MIGFHCCHSGDRLRGHLGAFCLQTSLLEFAQAQTSFLYQVQFLLGYDQEIDWALRLSILLLYSNQELGG